MTFTDLLDRNRAWVADRVSQDPDYFRRQAGEHAPVGLFIGCSDARVPANVITGTEIGELFVHRNVANQVVATDNNLLAVIQYAVEVLGVQDIVVCGHEECGGVKAALGPRAPDHVEGWLAHVRTVARLHEAELSRVADPASRTRRLVELNVREQVYNLSRLSVVQAALASGRELRLHGWVYGISDGLLRDLGLAETATALAAAPDHARPARIPGPGEVRAGIFSG
jgi:carbonic anhydrase